MELLDFLRQIQAEVRAEITDRIAEHDQAYPYPEAVFAEKVMEHMAEIGMTYEPTVCHFDARVSNAKVRLSGYAITEELDQLDLFVSLYAGTDDLISVPDSETKSSAEQCLRFLAYCAEGKLASKIDESNDAYPLAVVIQNTYRDIDQIRIYVLTDRQSRSKMFKSREISGKTIRLEVMDIERLHNHLSEGKPRDELVVNFEEVSGGPLPCVYVPGNDGEYDYALAAVPGEALRFIYEKFGARLLEANVRSFLNATGKVNRGIRDTLRDAPERFMAYNNGIVVVADEAHLGRTSDGSPGIVWLKGMQIVNGGQTTASIYFTKKKFPEIKLKDVRIPAKIIVLRSDNQAAEESLISDISRYANSQNSVKQSDLSANAPFHVELEKLSMSTYCPDGVGRWFYERASGSYNTMLSREGSTPAKLKHLKQIVVPAARKLTKTDLTKFVNAWNKKPDIVSLGLQKNFQRFMEDFDASDDQTPAPLPDVATYKSMIAQAILFKKATSIVRPMFPAFQGNVVTYLIAVLSEKLGAHFHLEKIWANQDISEPLKQQLQTWAHEVHEILQKSSDGRMISEWAKKPECWKAVRSFQYSPAIENIPEVI